MDKLLRAFLQIGVIPDSTLSGSASGDVGNEEVQAFQRTSQESKALAGSHSATRAGSVCSLAITLRIG